MVTVVLNDSTNQPTKRPKQQRMHSEQQKDRPSTSKVLFAPQPQIFLSANLLPMPKALTASLPVFDVESEKFELLKDPFRNNIKMYPHLTEIQKINYFHSLLRGNALQAYCNLDDTKKHNLEDVITASKRRFGDFQSSAKARFEWVALHFDPHQAKLHELLDILQKTAIEAFGSEAQEFIEKAIYAKMPDNVKKILNRAYLEDKPDNDILLHLDQEMRLNGLGEPDETTLVTLNTVDAVMTDDKKEQQQRGYCFHCSKYGHYKAQCRRLRKERYYANSKTNTKDSNKTKHQNPSVIREAKCAKPRNAGRELMRQMTLGKENENSPFQQIRSTNIPYLPRHPKQKTKIAAPTRWVKSRREGVHHRRTPKQVRRGFFHGMQ